MNVKRKDCNHTEGYWHDCDYVNSRNKLIPEAIRQADLAHPLTSGHFKDPLMLELNSKRWDTKYLTTMDLLWAERATNELLIKSKFNKV